MVHVLQRYGSGAPAWLVEGIPDYVRFYVIDPGPAAADFVLHLSNYDNGYRPTAAMLDWLEHNRGPGVVARLDASLRDGTYTDDAFEQITGLKPQAAWEQFARWHRDKETAK